MGVLSRDEDGRESRERYRLRDDGVRGDGGKGGDEMDDDHYGL